MTTVPHIPVTRSKSASSSTSVSNADPTISSNTEVGSDVSDEEKDPSSPAAAVDAEPVFLTLQQQEEQLLAANAALDEQIAQVRVSTLQQQLDTKRAALDALLLSAVSSSSSVSPSTPVRVPLAVNRTLFNLHSASTFKAAPTVATLAKRQSIANLPTISSSVVPRIPAPTVSVSPHPVRHAPPTKFSGSKEEQNAAIAEWIDEANIYLRLSRIAASEHLDHVEGMLTGYALKWLREKKEEVEAAHRAMTWDWLQVQLIDEFGRSSGVAAQQAEWLALRMGTENGDGTRVGGKATYTVKDYTGHFNRLMRALTQHTLLTTDLLVIDRYLQGIRTGYTALWVEMKGNHSVLSYESLSDAITGAQVAESALAVGKMQHSPPSSSSSSSYRSRHTAQVNNLQGEPDTEDTSSPPPRSPAARKEKEGRKVQVNAFVYKPVTEEGRYKLTETQARNLYDHRRCYRCYESHPKMGQCSKKMTAAPLPLK